MLKKKSRFLSKVKSKYWQQDHRYGIEIPKSDKNALELDQKNSDSQWWESIMTEMHVCGLLSRPWNDVYWMLNINT